MTTMTDDATGVVTEQVHHLPVDRITPDPTNPRVKLRDIEQLTESVRLHGVLEAITVREVTVPSANGTAEVDGYMVVRGHRRLAAAKAAGRDTIRGIIADAGQAEKVRAAQRLVENLHRDDLTAPEVAAGVQQMLDLDMTTEDVAAALALDVSVVAQASTVARSKGVALVAKRYDVTMDQAAALAEFEDDVEAFKDLAAVLVDRPQYFDQRVAQFRQVRRLAQSEAEAGAVWAAKGYAVLAWGDANAGTTVPLYAIKAPRGKKPTDTLGAASHKACPGRAVVVHARHNGEGVDVSHYCTDPDANGHTLLYKRSTGGELVSADRKGGQAPGKAAPDPKAQLAGRTHRAAMAASRAACEVRQAFVVQLLARRTAAKGMVPFTVGQLVSEHAGMEPRQAPTFGALVGIESGGTYGDHTRVQEAYLAKVPANQVLNVLLARACAAREYEWEANTWDRVTPERAAYLAFLVDNGYTPATVEQVALGKATGAQVLAEHDAVRAASKAQPAQAAAKKKAAPAKRTTAKKRAAKTAKRTATSAPAKKRAARRTGGH